MTQIDVGFPQQSLAQGLQFALLLEVTRRMIDLDPSVAVCGATRAGNLDLVAAKDGGKGFLDGAVA